MQVINAIRSAIRFSTSQRETPKECFSILSRSAPPLSLSLSRSPLSLFSFAISMNLVETWWARLILSYTKEIYGSNKSNLYVLLRRGKFINCNLTLLLVVPRILDENYTQICISFFQNENFCRNLTAVSRRTNNVQNISYLSSSILAFRCIDRWIKACGLYFTISWTYLKFKKILFVRWYARKNHRYGSGFV